MTVGFILWSCYHFRFSTLSCTCIKPVCCSLKSCILHLFASPCLLHLFFPNSSFCFFSSGNRFDALENFSFWNTTWNFMAIICSMNGLLIAISTSAALMGSFSCLFCLTLLSYYFAYILRFIPEQHVFTSFGTPTLRYITWVSLLTGMLFDICPLLLSNLRSMGCCTTWPTCMCRICLLMGATNMPHALLQFSELLLFRRLSLFLAQRKALCSCIAFLQRSCTLCRALSAFCWQYFAASDTLHASSASPCSSPACPSIATKKP